MRNPFTNICRLAGWAALVLFSSRICAGERAGFDFLRFELGARPAALAGAFTAYRGDLTGTAFNPASLASVSRQEIVFSYLNHPFGFKSGFIAWGKPIAAVGTAAFSIAYLNYGEFEQTDQINAVIGSFSANDWVMTAALARPLIDNLEAGLSLKFIRSQIFGYSASAMACDAGLIYFIPKQALSIGLSAVNLGAELSTFMDTREKLPSAFRAGFCKRLAHLPLALNFNLIRYLHDPSEKAGGLYWALGGEFTLSKALLFRIGYNSLGVEQKASIDDRFSGITAGLGIEYQRYRFDISFENQGALGNRGQGSLTLGL
jgi:hypothetical protein